MDRLIDKYLDMGQKKAEEIELFQLEDKSIEIGVFGGEIDKYSISGSGGISIRASKDGKMGYSYTENMDENLIESIIEEAIANSEYSEDEYDKINQPSKEYHKYEKEDPINHSSIEEKIEFTRRLEVISLEIDSRITSVQMAEYQEYAQKRAIVNSEGVDLDDESSGAIAYLSVVAKDGENVKTGSGFRAFRDISEVNAEDIAKEAVEEAVSMLGAKPVKSGNYPAVLKNSVFASLIEAFSSVFSADDAQKGLSLLNDKINKKIAVSKLTLVDDPFLKGGFASRSFDGEGLASKYKKVIDCGVLTSLLHNSKTAMKEDIDSTGNGYRGSYKSTLGIAPSNFYVERGDKSFEELIKPVVKGIYITNVQGLHSGLNTVSGDFSLSASGYLIEEGEKSSSVDQITIAGNIYDLLNEIEEIADDLKFGFPGGSYFGSPSIRIKSISVAGE